MLTKLVDGVEVQMSPEEEAEIRQEWAKADAEAQKTQYVELRRQAYLETFGPVENELDYIYHNGLDAWKEQITLIKEQYPKPEVKDDSSTD